MAFRALGDRSRCLDVLNRYESRFDSQYARALILLTKLNQLSVAPERALRNEPNPESGHSRR